MDDQITIKNKWSIILSKCDNNKNEAYVINYGISPEEIYRKFGCTPEEYDGLTLSIDTAKIVLANAITNYKFEALLALSNNYNRDQSEINILKHQIETRLQAQGYKIINHIEDDPNDVKIEYDAHEYINNLTFKQKQEKEIIDLKKQYDTLRRNYNDLMKNYNEKENQLSKIKQRQIEDLEGKLYEKDKRIEALQFGYDDLKQQYDYITKKDENVTK